MKVIAQISKIKYHGNQAHGNTSKSNFTLLAMYSRKHMYIIATEVNIYIKSVL